RTPPARREARRPGVHREVRLAHKAAAAAIGAGHHLLVVGESTLFRRLAAGTDLGLLAAGAAHLPPPHPAASLAAAGRAARSGDLRPLRRRAVGRGRPDVLARCGEAGSPVVLAGTGFVGRTRIRRGSLITAARGRPPRRPGVARWPAKGGPAR